MVVTLNEAKAHLRYEINDTANDAYLDGLILAADVAIRNYINTEPTSDHAIVQAALLLIGFYDEHRNSDKDMPTNGNYLPAPVQALLYPYRNPTAV